MNIRFTLTVAAIFILASCATQTPVESAIPAGSAEPAGSAALEDTVTPKAALSSEAIEDIQASLAGSARSLIGNRTIEVRGRKFNPDCVGVILGVYWASGIDLLPVFNRYTGNGVSRLYQALQEAGLLHSRSAPEPGDLIFWDNTYDRNRNGDWDDTLTHTGIVVEVDTGGTITYVHYHYKNGVVAAAMNLVHPSTWRQGSEEIEINSPLRMRGSGTPDSSRWLSGQLFRVFGQAYLLSY